MNYREELQKEIDYRTEKFQALKTQFDNGELGVGVMSAPMHISEYAAKALKGLKSEPIQVYTSCLACPSDYEQWNAQEALLFLAGVDINKPYDIICSDSEVEIKECSFNDIYTNIGDWFADDNIPVSELMTPNIENNSQFADMYNRDRLSIEENKRLNSYQRNMNTEDLLEKLSKLWTRRLDSQSTSFDPNELHPVKYYIEWIKRQKVENDIPWWHDPLAVFIITPEVSNQVNDASHEPSPISSKPTETKEKSENFSGITNIQAEVNFQMDLIGKDPVGKTTIRDKLNNGILQSKDRSSGSAPWVTTINDIKKFASKYRKNAHY